VRPLQGKVVLITGAGRGIGKRLAIGFAAAGARLGLIARTKAELDLVDLEIEHAGGASIRLRCDVRNASEVQAAVERLRASYGPIDAAVCAAAVLGPVGPLAETDCQAWADAIGVNLVGAMHVMRALLPQMIERRAGKIVLLTGEGADAPRPAFSAYAASKAALVRLAETAAEEVRDRNVQINCMNPGPTYTHMTDEILRAGARAGAREARDAAEIRASGGTLAERQTQLALFLATERSNHISGKLLHVGDDWKRLERANVTREIFTLRRLQRA
jgi:NAD(P)-dependent dehydrogenase (short-subunit alcohol dehydrogenase family)